MAGTSNAPTVSAAAPSPSGPQLSQRDPTSQKGKKAVIWLVVSLAVLVAIGASVWWLSVKTYHLETVTAGVLYRDGNRGVREFATGVRKIKPVTVVSLIDDAELTDPEKPQFALEAKYLGQQSIKLERLPILLGGWPTDADLQRFIAIVEDPAKRPVLVHCAQGVRRTGMMVAAYQESVLGWDKARVKAAMLTFGHSQRTTRDVERFIDNYDPKARAMRTKLEQSVE